MTQNMSQTTTLFFLFHLLFFVIGVKIFVLLENMYHQRKDIQTIDENDILCTLKL